MTQKSVHLFVLTFLVSLFLCGPVFSLEATKPEKQYRNCLILENNAVYGVTYQKNEDGKYIPIELTGEEKVKVILYEFTMKDDVTIEIMKSDRLHKHILDILAIEKKLSVKLLREWLKDINPRNREKAAYLMEVVNSTANIEAKKVKQKRIETNSILPPFQMQLIGGNEVRIKNPNDFKVTVGLRSGNQGKDFEVTSNGGASISVPNGEHKIYFVYSNKPDALFQGDDFVLNSNGIEIQIVKVVGGNYGIRQVK
jgi:hypothetical protein